MTSIPTQPHKNNHYHIYINTPPKATTTHRRGQLLARLAVAARPVQVAQVQPPCCCFGYVCVCVFERGGLGGVHTQAARQGGREARTSLRVRGRLERGLRHEPHRLVHVAALHHAGSYIDWICVCCLCQGGAGREEDSRHHFCTPTQPPTHTPPPPLPPNTHPHTHTPPLPLFPYLARRTFARASDRRMSDSSCRGVAVMVFPSPPQPRRARYDCTSCSPACMKGCVCVWGGGGL